MVDNEDKPLAPGPAFGFVQALENVNLQLLKIDENEKNLFDVVLVSFWPFWKFYFLRIYDVISGHGESYYDSFESVFQDASNES